MGAAGGACWAVPAGLDPGAVGAVGRGAWLRGRGRLGSTCALALDVGQDVLPRDATGMAGARDLGEVEFVLTRQPAHGWRDAAFVVAGWS